MRPNCRRSPAPKARVISVLAVPGTPSSRMWPPTRRLVSMKSMTSSWPTTALRTSPRSPSVTTRMSCTSIEDLPLPAMYVAGEPHQRRQVAPAAAAELARAAPDCTAIDVGAARGAQPLQPSHQPFSGKAARRMQLARHVAHGLLDVTRDHHLLMTRGLDHLGHVLQQPLAPRPQRRRRHLGHAE